MPELAVIFGGPSPEHDVSVLTGLQACHALADTGVHALYWTKAGEFFEVDPALEARSFVDAVPNGSRRLRLILGDEGGFTPEGGRLAKAKALDLDVVVNCCHGGPGEDGTLQGLLDLAGLGYTGPTVAAAAIGMDKLAFGAAMRAAGLPTLERVGLDHAPADASGPFIVKPRFGGSSIGIEIVGDVATARALVGSGSVHYRSGVVLEPYRSDLFDLQIAVRSWPELQLSAVERPLRAQRVAGSPEILGYMDKYVGGEGMVSAPREVPAQITPELEADLRQAARTVAQVASVRGVARVDFLSDGTEFFVNEVNTIPGSLSAYLWIEPKIGLRQLLNDLIAEARQSPTHHYTTMGADGTVLKGAGAIAAKLA